MVSVQVSGRSLSLLFDGGLSGIFPVPCMWEVNMLKQMLAIGHGSSDSVLISIKVDPPHTPVLEIHPRSSVY